MNISSALHQGRRILTITVVSLLACAVPPGARGQDIPIVTVGITNSTTDAAILIADKLGYFKEQGINVKIEPFDAASKMMAPAGSGQLDVAAGAPSAALYNAIASKVDVRIVADKGSAAPGYGYQPIMIRKALIASGTYKTPKDLKGMKLAEGAQGTAAAAFVARMLKNNGLQYDDVVHVYLGFPLMIAAFENSAIDAAAIPEPFATIAERAGTAVRVLGNDVIYPNQQLTVLMYGGPFIRTKHDLAQKFMNGYIKGVRFYNDSLVAGHIRGRTANEVVTILSDAMQTKDPSIFRAITANAADPNGRLNVESLRDDLAFFRSQGLVKDTSVTIESALDQSFAEESVKTMGVYRARK